MCKDIHALLNAYLDGELHGRRLMEVKDHLASCTACHNELQELHTVSVLLHAAPAPEFLPTERFVAQLTLQLPRRALGGRPSKPAAWAWWLIPAGLLATWFFLRTVFALTTAITAADATGLLGQSNAWFTSSQPQELWFMAVNSLFGSQMSATQQSTFSLFNQVSVFGGDLYSGFLWQVIIVLLYWGWLVFWWYRRTPPPMKGTATAL